jgi:hypothetical protein
MVRYSLYFILGLTVAFGQKQGQDNGTREKTAATKSQSSAAAIPAGASEVSPGLFKHTDNAGKTWLYRKTPFGVVKTSETPEASASGVESAPVNRANPFGETKASPTASAAPNVTAVEDGDSYKFERSTPFGPTRWTRKKSELTADEQEIVQRTRARKNDNAGSKE